MKPKGLPPAKPLRSTNLPWRRQDMLPPENPNRKQQAAANTVAEMPRVFTTPLVDLVADAAKLSKSKARIAIRRGKVFVNGTVVLDPDMRVGSDAVVEAEFRASQTES